MEFLEFTQEQVAGDEFFDLLTEKLERRIDPQIKQRLQSKAIRRQMRNKYGSKAFLLPEEMKFPIVNPDTGKLDCALLHAAYVRARQWMGKKPGYSDLAHKAKQMLADNNCGSTIGIKLENVGEFEMDDILQILE